MLGLLRDGFSLCDEQQSLRQPFLHIVDQVWKVLGDLIQGVLRRLVRALILVTQRVDDVAGRGFDASQRVEHVEHAPTALQARPCHLVVHHDALPVQPFCQRRQQSHLGESSRSAASSRRCSAARCRWHILVHTPVAHCINLELECQQKLPEGTLAQVAPC